MISKGTRSDARPFFSFLNLTNLDYSLQPFYHLPGS